MTVRLRKESRELLPLFIGTLLFIVVPYLIWGKEPGVLGYFALALGSAIMAAASVGHEFQHRTLSLLLSQPISRSVIWREKMLVLAVAIGGNVAALWVCLKLFCPQELSVPALVFIPLCAFCSTPLLTMLVRNSIAGVVFSFVPPLMVLSVLAAISDFMHTESEESILVEQLIMIVLVLYCAVCGWLGYTRFKTLQALEVPRELSLPRGLEAWLTKPFTRMSGSFTGTFAVLVKKEFRLQQISFVLTGVFCLLALAGFCVYWIKPVLGEWVLAPDLCIYVLMFPLVAGAMAVAEERSRGIATWHLTLPPSVFKQWSAKILVSHSVTLLLGLALPTAIFLAGGALLAPGDYVSKTGPESPPWYALLFLGSMQLLCTTVACYTGSFCNDTLRAALVALGLILAMIFLVPLSDMALEKFFAIRWIPGGSDSVRPEWQVLSVAGASVVFLLCFFQILAYSNYRQFGWSRRRAVLQVISLLVLAGCVAMSYMFWLKTAGR